MAETVLETEGLTMRFGGVVAVDGVALKLRARELRCLIGPNGAGKSTCFKCLCGLLKPSEGRIWLRGDETTGWDPHRIAALGVGIKMQVSSVMDGLSVHENIWMAARRWMDARAAAARADEVIDRLALGPIARAEVGRLSHGERQRVELGIVIAPDPWLVLLDEPAAGMTADEVERMGAIIRDLTRTAAVIVVEHDMQFIRSLASTVTVFHRGRVLVVDHVDRVMADPVVRDVYLGKQA